MPEPQPARGFILQPTYRIVRGAPVVHVWGRLESGESFLILDRRLVPHFYVAASDAARARTLGITRLTACDRVSFDGEPLVRIEVPTPPDTVPARQKLIEAGITTYEADVRFGIRYLIDHGVRGSVAIAGAGRSGRRADRVFEEPELSPADWTPRLRVLSFDIETDPRARRILSVALDGCGASEVILLTPPGYDAPPGAEPVGDEATLLRRFCERVVELDPDILTGWNVDDFDFAVMLQRAEDLGVRFQLGRGGGAVRRLPGRRPREATRIVAPGRLVLDGLALVRGAFMRFESFALDAVAGEVLGRRKLIRGPDRAEEILRAFESDRPRLVEYNLEDARLVREILEKLELVELAVERSRLTGMPPDRVSASIAAFDFLYLSELGRRGVAAPSVRRGEGLTEPTGGGHVLKPEPGLYENVAVLDFKSLYPSIIRTFQIDPLGHVAEPDAQPGSDPPADLIVAPNGAAFRRDPGILPALLDELFPRREAAKRAGNSVASFAIKILMNSFFGVLGTPACRFYNPAIANAITSFGRELLRWSRRRIESYGRRVLYGDTDSLFVETGLADAREARELGERLAADLNRDLAEHVATGWRVDSRLELEFERLYLKLFLPPLRHGAGGAAKRYAGLVDGDEGPEVVFTGLEAVRSDQTELARRLQRQLYERLFLERPVDEYLARLVAEVRGGEHDRLLVYRKAMRKPPDAYTSTTPPHVAAARKMSGRPGRRIAYVITVAGPEPAAERRNDLDYEHYVDKQIRPVAEPVLDLLELDFKRVIGDETQMGLFE